MLRLQQWQNKPRKFNPRRNEGIFNGYTSHNKVDKVYNESMKIIEESVHVFEENNEDNIDLPPFKNSSLTAIMRMKYHSEVH